MLSLESKIEAILFFKNEPVTLAELSKWLDEPQENLQSSISNLQKKSEDRGIVLVTNGDEVSLGTHPTASSIVEKLQKEELSRELSRASLETLAIILYRGPISRREIDHIRGVNSSFILRSLLVRGLIERTDEISGERSYTYKTTIKLLEHLGVSTKEALPEYKEVTGKIEEFVRVTPAEQEE